MRVNFLRVWAKKHKLEILKQFSINLLRKLLKCIILAYFSKHLTNHELIFCAFGRKTHCWEILRKFYRKIDFLIFILENLLLKIEP